MGHDLQIRVATLLHIMMDSIEAFLKIIIQILIRNWEASVNLRRTVSCRLTLIPA